MLSPKSERISSYVCVSCAAGFEYEPQPYTCRHCGQVLDVIWDNDRLKKQFDKERLANRKDPSIWRYRELLPVENPEHFTRLRVGSTPLYEVRALRRQLGLARLWIKDDGLNATGSYKDRASAVGVAAALDGGYGRAACASTGNAASSLSGIAASLGLETWIFVPHFAPVPKVTQLLMYGSRVFTVQGSYDETYQLAETAIRHYGWYNRNAAVNPFLVEGKKTAAFEVAEQMDFEPPDVCLVAVGDGCTVASLYKGFRQFVELGLCRHTPRLIGVQSALADPLVRAFESDGSVRPLQASSYADSINVGQPANAIKALKAVRDSNGAFVRVSDEEIQEAQRELARSEGIFGEPAGVTGFAGLRAALGQDLVDPGERVVVLMTGHGLKDVDGARRAVGRVEDVPPDFTTLREIVGES